MKKIISFLMTFLLVATLAISTSFAAETNSNKEQIINPQYVSEYITEHHSAWEAKYFSLFINVAGQNMSIGDLWHNIKYCWDETWEINAETGSKIRLISRTTPIIIDATYSFNAYGANVIVLSAGIAPDGSYYRTHTRIQYTEPRTGMSYTNEDTQTTYAYSLPYSN